MSIPCVMMDGKAETYFVEVEWVMEGSDVAPPCTAG